MHNDVVQQVGARFVLSLLYLDPNPRATAKAALQSPSLSTSPPKATTIMSSAPAAVFAIFTIQFQPPAVVPGASAFQHAVSIASCAQPVV